MIIFYFIFIFIGIYIISSNPAFPEMYELKVQQPKDKNSWIQCIRQAVLECPSSDVIATEDLTAEEKLRIGVNKRELIEKMRQKDIEQALLLEEKIMLQLQLLKEQKNFGESSATATGSGVATAAAGSSSSGNLVSAAQFLAAFGSYKDLVSVDCDTMELWRRVLNNVQEIAQLSSAVYTAATGLPVSRSVSSVGEKHSDNYASPTLPKRAETFAGFDEKRAKNVFPCRDVVASKLLTPRLQELEEKREPASKTVAAGATALLANMLEAAANNFEAGASFMPLIESNHSAAEPLSAAQLKDHNYAALQVSHHLHTLLCIISQQMTAMHSLQLQLALYRESPKTNYTHNDQLEELRNLQDKLQEEKTAWQRQKEQQEQELEEIKQQQAKLQAQIKSEQEDIKQQREQLYRKMEMLSNQGLLLSPNTPLLIASPPLPAQVGSASHEDNHDGHEGNNLHIDINMATVTALTGSNNNTTVDRRKDKWGNASNIYKTPPEHLLSATNAPKVRQASIKQKIPMKLSSLSTTPNSSNNTSHHNSNSAKVDKSQSFHNSSGIITQLLPLKLADKRQQQQHQHHSQIVPQHSRTGSSPAIIQQTTASNNIPTQTATVTRADSATSSSYISSQRHSLSGTPTTTRNLYSLAASTKPVGTNNRNATSSNANSNNSATKNTTTTTANNAKEEEEIYF